MIIIIFILKFVIFIKAHINGNHLITIHENLNNYFIQNFIFLKLIKFYFKSNQNYHILIELIYSFIFHTII